MQFALSPETIKRIKENRPYQQLIEGGEKSINENKENSEGNSLESKTVSGIFGALFILSIFLLSSNITGNAISNMTKSGSSLLGIILFLSSVSGFFVYRRLRRK